ncbi:MAG: ERAP1-like C-terminal domain-containing protein, partial [Proteobacteria bacterium]|nr:ERAP1-like C-terminal domain-containing protein [Pseudomonadota bacterium]
LWLNESFATYFGYGVVDHFHPEWDLWDHFLHGQTETALDRDALHETFPMEIPGGEHVVINASTAPIIYNKGGSILRQVEGYVGKEAFKEGLRIYLKRHEYGCAASHHLWGSLEEVSAKPVARMMESWVEQAGFPWVSVAREGERLLLRQGRFTYLSGESEQVWLIPVVVRLFFAGGDSKTVTVLLEGREAVIDLDSDVVGYKVNEGQSGFYRVQYQEEGRLQELGRRIVNKSLASVDRWGLQNDLYAFVKRGDAALESYLDFLSYYSDEEAFLPLISIAGNLCHAFLVMDGERRERVGLIGRGLFEKVLKRIGYEPRPEEKEATTILRDQLIWYSVLYGSEEVTAFAEGKFAELRAGRKVHPDIMKSVMQVGARHGDRETLDWFRKRIKASESEHERLNILTAIGCFGERGLIERVKQYILDDVPNRNKFVPITALSENPAASPSLWEWYLFSLEAFEQFHPVHYERVLAAIIPISGIGREEEIHSFFKAYMVKKEKAKDVIRLSLEKLQINSRMRRS